MASILVLEKTPKNCLECRLTSGRDWSTDDSGSLASSIYCPACGLYVTEYARNALKALKGLAKEETKPPFCPLIDFPSIKVPYFDPNNCDIEEEKVIMHEIDGYNQCVKELKEESDRKFALVQEQHAIEWD